MTELVLARPPADAPYRDASRPIAERVADLLARMTREEKLAQIGSATCAPFVVDGRFDEEGARRTIGIGVGELGRLGAGSSFPPSQVAQIANDIQRFLVEQTRLGIPVLFSEESIAGLMARSAPSYPIPLAMGASFDPDLVAEIAATIRVRMACEGLRHTLAPVLDLGRDPRWGRIEETYGEDPYLAAALGVAYVRAIQGTGEPGDIDGGVVATGKHFAGHGAVEAGLNASPVHVGPREMREQWLLPFEAAVRDGGIASIMPAYNEVDGMPVHADRHLLTDVLRGEWGFDGVIHADNNGIAQLVTHHRMAPDFEAAGVLGLRAGIDLETADGRGFGAALSRAIDAGAVSGDLLDEAAGRMLALKFRVGAFDRPYVDVDAARLLDRPTDEERALARRLAVRSIVLLRNDGVLPLAAPARQIALVGPLADGARELFGDYSYVATLETLREMTASGRVRHWLETEPQAAIDRELGQARTILAAARDRLSGRELRYAAGCGLQDGTDEAIAEAVEAARGADVAIVVAGERSGMVIGNTCGESRDRRDIGLPGRQQELLEAIVATGTPTILVVLSGRPLALEWAAEHCAAILFAWVPGDEGAEALWDVLLGDANPGGKLPVTFPRTVGAIPVVYSRKPSGGQSFWRRHYVDGDVSVLWPFGFGLSYSTFEVTNLRLGAAQIDADGGEVTIEVDVENTGDRPGDEVVQLYVRDESASTTRPVKELRGFRRVTLLPRERRTVSFRLAAEQLCLYDPAMRRVVEPGLVRVMVGTSSDDLPLVADLQLTGEVTEVAVRTRYLTPTSVR